MYTKQEAGALSQQFWSKFGLYMQPIPSSLGEKVPWLNYRTGIEFLQFRMDADESSAYIGIEISHPQKEIQEIILIISLLLNLHLKIISVKSGFGN